MKISKTLFIILGLILLISCGRNQQGVNDKIYYDEFYSVLNDLIRFSFSDVSAISFETVPVIKPPWIPSSQSPDSVSVPEPNSINVICYNWLSFYSLAKLRDLDSAEVDYMYRSIDSSKLFLIDSSRVCVPVITKSEFREFFQDSGINKGYKLIEKKYGSSCYVSVSTPVFNADYSKIILSVNYYCGPSWGYGYEFVLKKKKGKWRLIDQGITWQS